jgi:hypothetical protein
VTFGILSVEITELRGKPIFGGRRKKIEQVPYAAVKVARAKTCARYAINLITIAFG